MLLGATGVRPCVPGLPDAAGLPILEGVRRHPYLRVALLGAIVLIALSAAAGSGASPRDREPALVLAAPSHGRVYHAAYPDFGDAEQHVTRAAIRHFERVAGKRLAWVYFSNNWWHGKIRFPARAMGTIFAAHRTPFVRLMARSSWRPGRDAHFTMESIVDGRWDSRLRSWCDDAAAIGRPFLAEFGTEVNGRWFPWNGKWNGAGRSESYGDPALADGPERFRDAYRHLIEICREQGADQITWFFHVDVEPDPDVGWNRAYSNYYPGDGYIDWIGLSNYGRLDRYAAPQFVAKLARHYRAITRISDKPIAVLEYGRIQSPGDRAKAAWIRRAIDSIAARRFPRIHGLSYWNERYTNDDGSPADLRVDSSNRVRRAYRTAIASHRFTGRARFEPR
jgi:hypothetical protein